MHKEKAQSTKRNKVVENRKDKKERTAKTSKAYIAVCIGVVVSIVAAWCTYSNKRKAKIQAEEDRKAPLVYYASLPGVEEIDTNIDIATVYRDFKIRTGKREIESAYKRYAIVQAKKGTTLVSSVFVMPMYYRTKDTQEKHPVIEIYNVWVNKAYRGQRQSLKHMYMTLKYLQQVYPIDEKTVVALHVSPKDTKMEVAYALYRTNGFVRGAFSRYGPVSYSGRYDEIKDIGYIDDAILAHPYYRKKYRGTKQKEADKYLTMFTTVQEFSKALETDYFGKDAYGIYYKQAKRLRRMQESMYEYP